MKIFTPLGISVLITFWLINLPEFSFADLKDSLKVIELNKTGFDNRLKNPDKTIVYAQQALSLSRKINYLNGIGESYRVLGVGYNYLQNNNKAIKNYLQSLNYFQQSGNLTGQAKVNNNIGNLYVDIDQEQALKYYLKSLKIAEKLSLDPLIGGLNLNIGTLYYRKKEYTKALGYNSIALEYFERDSNVTGITQCLNNRGNIYFYLKEIDKSEELLIKANKMAKENDFFSSISNINLTLSSVYISKNEFQKAENSLKEGIYYTKIVKDYETLNDYLYTSYELESKRKNYKKALEHLTLVYRTDSSNYATNLSENIGLFQQQFEQEKKQKENEIIIERQKYDRLVLIGTGIITSLCIIVIYLMQRHNIKTQENNKKLTLLNKEVSRQKENLDRINIQQEAIINERTKDLQSKNKKLSEYSFHLSHQIRGPVATMKGLMILSNDKLIDHDDCLEQMEKCINNIDDKILKINEELHDPEVSSFS